MQPINITQQHVDEHFMQQAMFEAQKAREQDEIPIGCVIVCEGRIIGRGHNMTQTLQDVTAHAEMQAITAAEQTLAGKYLSGCTMYVTVEPCVMCAGALGWAQISRLVYGCSEQKKGFSLYAPQALHPKCSVTKGVLEDECKLIMQSFFAQKR